MTEEFDCRYHSKMRKSRAARSLKNLNSTTSGRNIKLTKKVSGH